MIKPSLVIDHSAITVSTLCLIHCLVLPVIVTSLPVLGVLSEAEWLHRLFVLIAMPLSLIAFLPPLKTGYKHLMRLLAISGVCLLATSAFVEGLHNYETQLTVVGALMLGGAHLCRIIYRRHAHSTLR
jgi:hypothetical protein